MQPKNSYENIIDLPHHVSQSHRQMPRISRAAQFASFAALTGFEAYTDEAARLTDSRPELTETMQNDLNEKIRILTERISEKPSINITHFIPDLHKEGGAIAIYSGSVRRIDEFTRCIIFTDRTELMLDNIISIEFAEQ